MFCARQIYPPQGANSHARAPVHPRPRIPAQERPGRCSSDHARASLCELVAARRQLCEECAHCANPAEHAASALIRRIAAQRIKRLLAVAECSTNVCSLSRIGCTAFGGRSGAFRGKRSIDGCCRPPREGRFIATFEQVSVTPARQHHIKNCRTPENSQKSFSSPSSENSSMLSIPLATSSNVPPLRRISLHVLQGCCPVWPELV